MQRLSLVVAGVPALAAALEATGRFEVVHSVESTGGLRQLVGGGLLKGTKPSEMVFLFGDTLTVDTPQTPLSALLAKLTTSGWKVILVALSPKAKDLVVAYPAAGILEGPFQVNTTLGAIAGITGVSAGLDPVDNGFETINLSGRALSSPPAQRQAPPVQRQAPVADAGWSTPTVAPVEEAAPFKAAPAPVQAQTPAAPAQPVAPTGGWDTPSFGTPPASFDAPAPAGTPAAPTGGWPDPVGTPVVPGAPTAPRRALRRPSDSVEAPAPTSWDAPPATSAPAPVNNPWGGAPNDFQSPPMVPGVAPAPDSFQTPGLTPGGFESGPVPGGFGGDDNRGPVARPGAYGSQHAVAERRGYVITITAPKGGTGKSSLTLNLATYLGLRLKAQGKTVCVIDTNFQQADTGKYLNVYNPNITNIVRDQTALQRDRIASHLVHRPDLNISALLGPATPMDASPVYINAKLYCQVLEILRQLYDYILIDTPVAEKFHDIFSGFALPQADFIIVPVAPNLPTLLNADAWLRTITAPRHTGGDDVDERKIGVVLNRAKANIDCSEEEVRQELASWNFLGSIPETDEWQRANNNYELVATKNFAELNEAFAHVLYAATNEQVLMENLSAPTVAKAGMGATLRRFLGRG